jgi:hypothetical protein
MAVRICPHSMLIFDQYTILHFLLMDEIAGFIIFLPVFNWLNLLSSIIPKNSELAQLVIANMAAT